MHELIEEQVTRGGSERQLLLERGASERWRLGASERMWLGASEWAAAGLRECERQSVFRAGCP